MPREILYTHPCFLTLKNKHPDVKCFIFDMDGTLLDSEETHSLAVRKLLEDNGQKDISIDWINETFLGLADEDVYKKLVLINKLKNEEISQGQFINQKNLAFNDILKVIPKEKLLHQNISNFIQEARVNSYKTALVTASEGHVTKALMNHIGGQSLFDTIKSREDFIKTKPHPMPYINTIKELGLNLNEVVIFEDSKTGIQSAVDSGAIVYQAKWH